MEKLAYSMCVALLLFVQVVVVVLGCRCEACCLVDECSECFFRTRQIILGNYENRQVFKKLPI